MTVYLAPMALLPDGWRSDVRISVEASGLITGIEFGERQAGDRTLKGPVLPGMPNLHSHAFQRAMAGLAEVALNPEDSFWTWRDLMYRLVGELTPEQVQAIATKLYIDMAKAGFTSIAEFHYVHHDAIGRAYDEPAELSLRVMSAAKKAGIGMTILPTFYAHGGFGGQPATEKQRRFINNVESYLTIVDRVRRAALENDQTCGLCIHSLRAATQDEIKRIMAGAADRDVVHIHIAEQTKEVEDCLAWSGMRPIQWLYRHFEPDRRWCLVHATHADEDEIQTMADSGAVVGLCPTTEANLGDGLFPAQAFIERGGRFGIGSDSHVSVSVLEEVRWLEYGQRLKDRRRNRLATAKQPNIAQFLHGECLKGGAAALGQPIGAIEIGKRADLVVLDGDNAMLQGLGPQQILGRWLFGGADNWIRDVAVGGDWIVEDGHHRGEEQADAAFTEALRTLLQ